MNVLVKRRVTRVQIPRAQRYDCTMFVKDGKMKFAEVEKNWPLSCVEKGRKYLFSEVFSLALDEKASYIKFQDKKISFRNTLAKYKSDYKRFISNTPIEDKMIDQITKRDLEGLCIFNLQRYDLRRKSFNSLKTILRMTFRFALENYLINDNPFERINFKKFSGMILKEVPISKRCYSDLEINQIMQFLHEKETKAPRYLPAYAMELQIIMGLRRGEIPPLRWSDFTDEFVTISREQITAKRNGGTQTEYFVIVEHTKTNKDRRYPITFALKEYLARLKDVHDRYYKGSSFLFPADSENGVITNSTIYDLYRRMCISLGLKQEKGVTKGTHAFRRNAITKVANHPKGGMEMASRLFGNSPQVAESNYYTGLDLDRARDVLEGK